MLCYVMLCIRCCLSEVFELASVQLFLLTHSILTEGRIQTMTLFPLCSWALCAFECYSSQLRVKDAVNSNYYEIICIYSWGPKLLPVFHVLVLSQLDSWLVTHRWRCIGKCFCQAAAVWSWTAGKDEQLKKSRSLHTDSLWQRKYPSRYSNRAHWCSWLYLGQFLSCKSITNTLLEYYCKGGREEKCEGKKDVARSDFRADAESLEEKSYTIWTLHRKRFWFLSSSVAQCQGPYSCACLCIKSHEGGEIG